MSDELLPVLLAPGQEPLVDGPYVAAVAQLAALRPVAAPVVPAADRPAAVLAAAAADERPLLVLPDPALPLPGSLDRLLVPVDRGEHEEEIVRSWVRLAEERGVAVRHLHVLAAGGLPVMWEGPGHHAEAWRDAIARRYRVGPAGLTVLTGIPPEQLRTACGDADLLLACWAGADSGDRALTLRALLADCPVPVLLVRRPPADGGAGSPARPVDG